MADPGGDLELGSDVDPDDEAVLLAFRVDASPALRAARSSLEPSGRPPRPLLTPAAAPESGDELDAGMMLGEGDARGEAEVLALCRITREELACCDEQCLTRCFLLDATTRDYYLAQVRAGSVAVPEGQVR